MRVCWGVCQTIGQSRRLMESTPKIWKNLQPGHLSPPGTVWGDTKLPLRFDEDQLRLAENLPGLEGTVGILGRTFVGLWEFGADWSSAQAGTSNRPWAMGRMPARRALSTRNSLAQLQHSCHSNETFTGAS